MTTQSSPPRTSLRPVRYTILHLPLDVDSFTVLFPARWQVARYEARVALHALATYHSAPATNEQSTRSALS